MEGESHESAVPSDPDGSRAELIPHLVVDVGNVLEGEPRPSVALVRDPHLDPRHLTSEFPGGGEPIRRLTFLDGSAGIAFELVPPTGLQVTGHGQKPARDPVGIGAGIPEIGLVSRVYPTDREHPGLPYFERTVSERALDGADVVVDIDRGHWFFLSRLPRATSVAKASIGPVHALRNRSSHSSTSWNPWDPTE